MNTQKAFSILELMVVVILIGIIASFAIPQYYKAIDKAHERDAGLQLTALHAANLIYRAQRGKYLGTDYSLLSDINNALGINIVANELTYNYDETGGGVTYLATATWTNSLATTFTIRVTQAAIDVATKNPCCLSAPLGNCQIVPAC